MKDNKSEDFQQRKQSNSKRRRIDFEVDETRKKNQSNERCVQQEPQVKRETEEHNDTE